MFGDIIYVDRKRLYFRSYDGRRTKHSSWFDQLVARTTNYRHFGIEVEDGYVIHYVGESFFKRKESKVLKTTLEAFAKDGQINTMRISGQQFRPYEVVQRAYSMLGSEFDGYSVTENNCEHFVTWCTCGERRSRQGRVLRVGQKIVKSPLYVKPLSTRALKTTLRVLGSFIIIR